MNKRGFRSSWVLVGQTAGRSTALRSGRDDKFIAPERLNCRSLGFARDDKGDGGASIWSGGSNDNLTDLVHSSLNLPQASQAAPNEQTGLPVKLDARRRNSRLHYAPPDFLWNLVALANSMRLSLRKGAHAASTSVSWQEIRVRAPVGMTIDLRYLRYLGTSFTHLRGP